MMTWVYALPAWFLMPASVIVMCALSVLALSITRRRLTRNDLITHNDVAGAILAMLGTVLAVMMSFMVAGVWQQYDSAGESTQTEASALADLYHIANAMPAAQRARIQTGVDRYISQLESDEWPLMRRGLESWTAFQTAYQIQDAVIDYKPAVPGTRLVQPQALTYVATFLDARRQRLYDNASGIPSVLWSTMLVVGVITIFFSFYFKVERPIAQYIMVAALTAVITLIYILIAELDYPFRGDIAIGPDAYVHVYNSLHHIGFR
jgi:hypothetical protein